MVETFVLSICRYILALQVVIKKIIQMDVQLPINTQLYYSFTGNGRAMDHGVTLVRLYAGAEHFYAENPYFETCTTTTFMPTYTLSIVMNVCTYRNVDNTKDRLRNSTCFLQNQV